MMPHLTNAPRPKISVMSKNVSVIITDDLDGSENAETVSFGFGGVSYESTSPRRTGPSWRGRLSRSSKRAIRPRAAALAAVPAEQAAHGPIGTGGAPAR
jgi:hypothetical protein